MRRCQAGFLRRWSRAVSNSSPMKPRRRSQHRKVYFGLSVSGRLELAAPAASAWALMAEAKLDVGFDLARVEGGFEGSELDGVCGAFGGKGGVQIQEVVAAVVVVAGRAVAPVRCGGIIGFVPKAVPERPWWRVCGG